MVKPVQIEEQKKKRFYQSSLLPGQKVNMKNKKEEYFLKIISKTTANKFPLQIEHWPC